ncbi:DUF4097 family beta strand repeat-containing protein [Thalassotalea piscium]
MRKLMQLVSLTVMLIPSFSYAGERVDKTLALKDASKVIIENQRGTVKIVGSDDDLVSVKGELDEKTESFVFEHSGATIKIKVEMPNNQRNWRSNDEGSNLTISVPRQVRIGFSGISSDVDVSGFDQGVDIKTVSGEITVNNLHKLVDISSISGDIDSEQLSGKIQLSTVSGDLKDKHSSGRLFIKSVSGSINTKSDANEVSAETVSGDIDLSLAAIDELTISTVSGDSNAHLLLNEQGTVKLSSVSGEFDLLFEKGVQANFRLKTNAGGSIENRLTTDKSERGKYVPSEKLSFTTGNGSGSVKATTVSGDIVLRTN